MDESSQASVRALVAALHSVASYNDKGAGWMGHDAVLRAETVAGYQTQLTALATQLGEARLGAALYGAIVSGAAAHDPTGVYAERVLAVIDE